MCRLSDEFFVGDSNNALNFAVWRNFSRSSVISASNLNFTRCRRGAFAYWLYQNWFILTFDGGWMTSHLSEPRIRLQSCPRVDVCDVRNIVRGIAQQPYSGQWAAISRSSTVSYRTTVGRQTFQKKTTFSAGLTTPWHDHAAITVTPSGRSARGRETYIDRQTPFDQ